MPITDGSTYSTAYKSSAPKMNQVGYIRFLFMAASRGHRVQRKAEGTADWRSPPQSVRSWIQGVRQFQAGSWAAAAWSARLRSMFFSICSLVSSPRITAVSSLPISIHWGLTYFTLVWYTVPCSG